MDLSGFASLADNYKLVDSPNSTIADGLLNNIFDFGGTFSGNIFAEGGSIYIAPIPEPATCAAIFGALALALAAYRRRKAGR